MAQDGVRLGLRTLSRRWLTTSNRLQQSLPTRRRPLGRGCASGLEEPTLNSRVCAHVFVRACICWPVPRCICLCPFVQQFHLNTRYNGPAEICHRVAQKTKLRFAWHLTAEGINETCDVQVLLHNAVRRGVHLPQAWKSKWPLGAEVLSFVALAREAVQRSRDEFSLADDVKLDCRPSQTHTCAHLYALVLCA